MWFLKIWPWIQPGSQPQTTCHHTSQGSPNSASSPAWLSGTSHSDTYCNSIFVILKNCCTESVFEKLICILTLTTVQRWNQPEWASAQFWWLWRSDCFFLVFVWFFLSGTFYSSKVSCTRFLMDKLCNSDTVFKSARLALLRTHTLANTTDIQG